MAASLSYIDDDRFPVYVKEGPFVKIQEAEKRGFGQQVKLHDMDNLLVNMEICFVGTN
jgi:hypothetical protein